MDLLTNATSSIKLGVEDYLTGESDRMLSAVRNVHAGILLLYKEALRRKSPPNSSDVLVKAQMRPELDSAGELVFVGIGKKTVDVNQIRDRFSGLGITTRWELLDKITEARNDLEHYIPKHSQAALEGLIANALTVIRDFITRELEKIRSRFLVKLRGKQCLMFRQSTRRSLQLARVPRPPSTGSPVRFAGVLHTSPA
jgi:hypothetical protein